MMGFAYLPMISISSSSRTTFSPQPLSHATMTEPMSSTPRTVPSVPTGGAFLLVKIAIFSQKEKHPKGCFSFWRRRDSNVPRRPRRGLHRPVQTLVDTIVCADSRKAQTPESLHFRQKHGFCDGIAVLRFLCYDDRAVEAEGLSALPDDDRQTKR